MNDILNVNFYSKIERLIPYTFSGLYTKEIDDVISGVDEEDMNNYINFITDNLFHNKNTYCYINGIKSKKMTNIYDNIYITYENDVLKFYSYSIEKYISLIEQDKKIIFRPIYMTINDTHHMMSLIFDKNNKHVILFDSNGSENALTIKIEKTISNIVNEINKSLKSSFILLPTKLWNSNNIILNKVLSKSPIYYGGFCVILSVLIPHYMLLTNNSIKTTMEIFDSFSMENFLSLINDYSLFYYVFCKL